VAIPAKQVKISRFVDRAIPAYARSLNRLTGDFSAAAAFLLSGELFERIGCTGRAFVATAKAAYADRGPSASPAETRQLAAELISEASRILDRLEVTAGQYREALAERKRTGELLAKAAEEVYAGAEKALAGGLQEVLDEAPATLPDDPEELAARLGAVASQSFKVLHGAWGKIYEELQNASLPPAPFTLSGRQMYIETVKLFNQHRLVNGSSDRNRQARGLFAGRRRDHKALPDPMETEAALELAHRVLPDTGALRSVVEKQDRRPADPPEAVVKIVEGVGDVIRAALSQWQRSALERAYRQGPQPANAAVDEATLQEELSQIVRTVDQLSALKAELARGLSARYYLISLLRRASSCSQSR